MNGGNGNVPARAMFPRSLDTMQIIGDSQEVVFGLSVGADGGGGAVNTGNISGGAGSGIQLAQIAGVEPGTASQQFETEGVGSSNSNLKNMSHMNSSSVSSNHTSSSSCGNPAAAVAMMIPTTTFLPGTGGGTVHHTILVPSGPPPSQPTAVDYATMNGGVAGGGPGNPDAVASAVPLLVQGADGTASIDFYATNPPPVAPAGAQLTTPASGGDMMVHNLINVNPDLMTSMPPPNTEQHLSAVETAGSGGGQLTTTTDGVAITVEQLRQQLAGQLQYYFSR